MNKRKLQTAINSLNKAIDIIYKEYPDGHEIYLIEITAIDELIQTLEEDLGISAKPKLTLNINNQKACDSVEQEKLKDAMQQALKDVLGKE